MKITKQRLQEIVKEEVERALMKEYSSWSGGRGFSPGGPAYDPTASPMEEEPMDAMTTIDLLMKARRGVAQNMPELIDDFEYVVGELKKMGEEHVGSLQSGVLPGSGYIRR